MKSANFGQTKLLGTQWSLIDRKQTRDKPIKPKSNTLPVDDTSTIQCHRLNAIDTDVLQLIDNNHNVQLPVSKIILKQRVDRALNGMKADYAAARDNYNSSAIQPQSIATQQSQSDKLLDMKHKLLLQHVNTLEINTLYKQFSSSQPQNTT